MFLKNKLFLFLLIILLKQVLITNLMKTHSLLRFFTISLIVFSTFSCKKKGCVSPEAINYDLSARKDDGSCTYPTYPTSAIIKSVTINSYPAMDYGSLWDEGQGDSALPDIQLILIEQNSNYNPLDTAFISKTLPNSLAPVTFNTSVVVSAEKLSNIWEFSFYDVDDISDGSYYGWNTSIDYFDLDLEDYTANGYEDDKYPTSITGTTVGSQFISYTIEIEWLE